MPTVSSGAYVVDDQYRIVNFNETAHAMYPSLQVGEKCYACMMHRDAPCAACPVAHEGPTDTTNDQAQTVDALEMSVEGHGLCHALVFRGA